MTSRRDDPNAVVTGLTGTVDSVGYRLAKLERHQDHYDHWFGLAASPSGETHWADHLTVTAFQSTAGNDTWGSWLQILGSSDTPHVTGGVYFELDTLVFPDVGTNASKKLHLIQIGYGASGAAALSADAITEVVSLPEKGGRADAVAFDTQRFVVGTKVWFRHWAAGQNGTTLDLLFALHEYEG